MVETHRWHVSRRDRKEGDRPVDTAMGDVGEATMITIRDEQPLDVEAIRAVHLAAFGQPQEATLVDQLREGGAIASLVAERSPHIIGHICFSPVEIVSESPVAGLVAGLAPLAVLPEWQRQGVGTQLVVAGIASCRQLGYQAIVVLGHPTYYPRFGFIPASRLGWRCEYDVPDEVFMVLELQPGTLSPAPGLVQYRPEFRVFG